MKPPDSTVPRKVRETVKFDRVEKMQPENSAAGLGPEQTKDLATCIAVKEACCNLFPNEITRSNISPADFKVTISTNGTPSLNYNGASRAVLDRYRVENILLSITHGEAEVSVEAETIPRPTLVPWYGRLLYHLFPYRRGVVLGNFRRVFGDTLPESEIIRLAQSYYAHYARFFDEYLRLPFMSVKRRQAWIRVENTESPIRALERGKGLILLTGHFGNFEVSTMGGISQFPQYHGMFHFVRRALKPALLNRIVTRRFRQAGFGVLPKRGSLDRILELLSQGALIVYVFDQHAGRPDGIVVDFFGHPAGTFKSVALLALETGAPVVPACSWREPDGSHVLRFEDPLPLVESDDPGEEIRQNTHAYNVAIERMILRHPEQWIWMHRRWKV
jgi:KDO2-lipid IV(A) lauroyltransferase